MSGRGYAATLMICFLVLLALLAVLLNMPDMEFQQAPEVQPFELRD